MKLNFRLLWQYTLPLAMLMFLIGIAIDTTDVHRYAHRMEDLMRQGKYQEALSVGVASDKTDSRLMQLRIEALAHEGLLGSRLFAYPVKGSSGDMAKKGGDYELCAYLIDKQLDKFVAVLPRYYAIDEHLPRYYREALIQYNHLRSTPKIVYHDNVLDTDYRDMQELERQYQDRKARRVAVFRQYEGTYWYYYGYLNPPRVH